MSGLATTGGAQGDEASGDRAPAPLPGVPRQRPAQGRRPVQEGQVRADEPEPGTGPESGPAPAPPRARGRLRPARRLLPTPTGTPFTFSYTVLLLATSLFAEYGDPGLVSELLRDSSTDVVHLMRAPLLVLVASALWSAGGLVSAYALAFPFVLTALERRIGGLRTAAVFFGGHVLATLATEVPVAFSVAAGQLPESSLQRLDYGISFGVMTCIGALAGMLPGWARLPLLAGVGFLSLTDLLAYADPMANWGHLLSLAVGVAAWPVLRHWRARRTGPPPLLGDLGHPALRSARTR
ncbi:rhomboid-like protein [Streptomyces sp. NBRC 110611]|uniref:rhomboid-like protein n=1 Tax=Streptomyces sp. NBRC 110611 TaxID=1621259 RepID=UPI000D1663ED|nr:rhomboid-like protein [Streptomyces sp. NBRC 110611]